MVLPLALPHFVLGQLDLWLDVLSIVSTKQVVRAYTGWTLCGRSVVSFFQMCLWVQLLLLAGNLLSQVGCCCMAILSSRFPLSAWNSI
jgi:hypothetical protein